MLNRILPEGKMIDPALAVVLLIGVAFSAIMFFVIRNEARDDDRREHTTDV